jgi:SAM-dependent methyltransferase
MKRDDKLLCCIDRSMRVLEMGPYHSPVAPKRAGWNSHSVDYTDQQRLREIWARSGGNPDTIEPVDFVWRAGKLHELVPPDLHGQFDACIASHVIEHIPDPIGFLRSLETLLTPDGVVALAVPDKRYCFDFFRPLTLMPAWLEAHERNAIRHSRRTVLESVAYFCNNRGRPDWGQEWRPMSLSLAREMVPNELAAVGEGAESAYIDCHAWCFVPSSFRLLMLELGALGMVDFQVERMFPPQGCEFITILRRGRLELPEAELKARRLQLLQQMIAEQGEQNTRMVSRWPYVLTWLPYRAAAARFLARLRSK